MGKSSLTQTTNPEAQPTAETKRAKSKKESKLSISFDDATMVAVKDLVEDQPGTSTTASLANENTPPSGKEKTRKKKAKARKAPEIVEEEDAAVVSVESPKKEKKRKRRANDIEEQRELVTIPQKSTTDDSVEEPPRKKHKNKTEFQDPRGDSALNSQSRKALEYAFTQMNRPKKWKFHKARQNWLIRNVWSPDLLPDIYFPLALKYLANVQGGSRDKLKESCQSYLKVEESPQATAPSMPSDSSNTTSIPIVTPAPVTSKPTPGPLISTAPTPGALIAPSTSSAASVAPPVSNAATILANVRRTRAQSLLDVLNSPSDT